MRAANAQVSLANAFTAHTHSRDMDEESGPTR